MTKLAKFYAAAFRCSATACESNLDSQCVRSKVFMDKNGCCPNCTIQTKKSKAKEK